MPLTRQQRARRFDQFEYDNWAEQAGIIIVLGAIVYYAATVESLKNEIIGALLALIGTTVHILGTIGYIIGRVGHPERSYNTVAREVFMWLYFTMMMSVGGLYVWLTVDLFINLPKVM